MHMATNTLNVSELPKCTIGPSEEVTRFSLKITNMYNRAESTVLPLIETMMDYGEQVTNGSTGQMGSYVCSENWNVLLEKLQILMIPTSLDGYCTWKT